MLLAHDPVARVEASLLAANILMFRTAFDDAAQLVDVAVGALEASGAVDSRPLWIRALELRTWIVGVGGLRERLAPLGVGDPAGDRAEDRLLLALAAVEAIITGRSGADGLALARRALAGEDLARPVDHQSVIAMAGVVAAADAVDEAGNLLTAPVDGGRRRGAVEVVVSGLAVRAYVELCAGRLLAAETDAAETLELATGHGLQ